MPQYVSGKCYVKISHKGGTDTILELPCYPDELQESTSANWSEQNIVGRSSPIAAYTGTGYRTISFSFTLHREMYCNDSDSNDSSSKIDKILAKLRKSVYPRYISKGLTPPITTFRFGEFVARGYVTSIGYNWKKPIINDKYQVCDVSISMNAYADKIISAGGLSSTSPLNPFYDTKVSK